MYRFCWCCYAWSMRRRFSLQFPDHRLEYPDRAPAEKASADIPLGINQHSRRQFSAVESAPDLAPGIQQDAIVDPFVLHKLLYFTANFRKIDFVVRLGLVVPLRRVGVLSRSEERRVGKECRSR